MDNKILAVSIPIFTLLILIEAFIYYSLKKDLYERKDLFASLSMGFG